MREIYYAIYKNVDYKTMVMVSIAEAIVSGSAKFANCNLKLGNQIGLNSFERQILNKICLNKISRFHISDYRKWIDFLIKECVRKKYIHKVILLGVKPTKYFKTQLEKKKNKFNLYIVKYIDSQDITYLQQIDKSLKNILLPDFKKTIKDRDIMAEMMAEASRNGSLAGASNL